MEFATGALGSLLPKLARLLQDECNLQKCAKKNIQFLTKELESIQAALCNVGEVPLEQRSELVKIWARDAQELSYHMEDVVDTFLVRILGPDQLPSRRSAKKFIKDMMGFVTKVKIRHEIGQEINDIKERVKDVVERRERYKLDDIITPTKTFGVDPRIASLYAKASDLVGLDETSEELITKLSAHQRIVSVVGFGGLGKTTLAKAVYDKLKGQFDCTAFVPVGRNPDLKKVFKDVIVDLNMDINLEILDERQLINKLREFLKNKRYFIVIDDVWDTRSWGTIKLALVENNGASRIIVTTRTHEVAREAGLVYKLQPLSGDDSRKLFFARIFGGESRSCVHQPDEVSEKILGKCGGIPLAIITMASLLVGKPREEWSEVHRSIGLGNKGNQQIENTMKILSFSYYDLPCHLRTCLLHLNVFPEDCYIKKKPLIWMWIAEGFVRETQGTSSFEVGEGYFNELVNRSMIQIEQWEDDGNVGGCRVHDMVLDLIRSISSEENFITVLDNNTYEGASSQGRVHRRLAFQNNRPVEPAHMDMQQVRSFIMFGYDIDKGVPLSSFRLVRVLALHTSSKRIERYHLAHLRNLIHLRYLRLSCPKVELPVEDIGTLKFLQTLDVDGYCTNEEPLNVGLLTQLLCLQFNGRMVDTVPDGIAKLASLEELQIYYTGDDDVAWARFVKELGSLRKLRVLHVGMQQKSMDARVQAAMVESLSNLERMEHLGLSLLGPVCVDTATWEAAGFLLPRCLRRLYVMWLTFSQLPAFCINPSRVPNLFDLTLYVGDLNEQDLRILGGLPQLRFLKLRVESTTELLCNNNTTVTDAAGDGCCLPFRKLRRCSIWSRVIRLKQDDSGSVSFRMRHVEASMLLGSQRKDDAAVSSGKLVGVAPTLMPSVQKLQFQFIVRELKDRDHGGGCISLDGLEYFASLQEATVNIFCNDASAAEVEEVGVALRRVAAVHPNRPSLVEHWFRAGTMTTSSAAKGEKDLKEILLDLDYESYDSASTSAA